MHEFDRRLSLEQLEGKVWGPPDFQSHLVLECHRLRKVPLADFSIENLRIMIGQELGLAFLIPIAIEQLELDPWAEGNFFRGDLLKSVVGVPNTYWSTAADLYYRLAEVIAQAKQDCETLNQSILPAWAGLAID